MLGAELSRARSPPCSRPGARVVGESDRRAPLELALPVTDERRYGDTLIRIHEPDVNRKAVCPGSYDPITNGHLDVIARAARMFDEVVVGVVNVQVRKSKALFGAEERCAMVEEATTRTSATSRVAAFCTLVVEFAHEQARRAIVKGLRTISDFGYEFEMNQLNRRQAPEIESVYLMAVSAVQFPFARAA